MNIRSNIRESAHMTEELGEMLRAPDEEEDEERREGEEERRGGRCKSLITSVVG